MQAPPFVIPDSEPILVTGASGFIGSALCRRLTDAGRKVIAVAHRHADDLPTDAEPACLDLGDADAVDRLIARVRPSVIFHLAGCVKGGRDLTLVRPTFAANLASTVHLMDAAAREGCRRFLLTGSLEEPDETRVPPSSPYAASKTAASAYARMFHALYAFPAVIARVFMVYGPGQKDTAKLVPYVINALLDKRAPELSGGARPVDWIHVDDVVEGLLRMAAAKGIEGRTVDLGTGRLETVRWVVEFLSRQVDAGVPLRFDPSRDRPLEQVRAADADATEALLGWRPPTRLEDGLAATVAWHRDTRTVATGRHAR